MSWREDIFGIYAACSRARTSLQVQVGSRGAAANRRRFSRLMTGTHGATKAAGINQGYEREKLVKGERGGGKARGIDVDEERRC